MITVMILLTKIIINLVIIFQDTFLIYLMCLISTLFLIVSQLRYHIDKVYD